MKRSFIFVPSIVFLCFACSEEPSGEQRTKDESTTQQITSQKDSRLMADLESPSETFSFDNSQERIIKTRNGSRIHIPANAFVNKDGSEIKGDVDFKVMEFNTFGEIIASQLPMTFTDDNGERVQFESAGMFSLAAQAEGKELALAQDKKINVEYATDVDGPFNFYRMKEDSSGWIPKDTDCLPKPNKYKAELEKRSDSLKANQPEPLKPVISYKEGDTLFDIKQLGNHKSQMVQLFTGIMWKYIGDGSTMNPTTNKTLFEEKYDLVALEKIDTSFVAFNLTFKTKNDTSIRFPAVPVFQGKLLDKQNEKMNKRLNTIAFMMKTQEELAKEAKREQALLRAFEVDQLGVYNYDVKYKDNQLIPMIADFSFEGQPDELSNIYLIPSSKRIVVRYTPLTFEEFAINPDDNNRMVAVLPNNEVYMLNQNDLNRMNLRSKADQTVKFLLKSTGKKISTAEELDNILADNS